MILRNLLTFVLLLASSLSYAQNKPVLVISDIDDTIKSSRILPRGNLLKTIMTILKQAPFTAMPELYQSLYGEGAVMHYVSGIPEKVDFWAKHFLKKHDFPVDGLASRPKGMATFDYKVARIKQIMLDNPNAKIILLGDNGEKDVAVFKALAQDAELKHIETETFVHTLYTPRADSKLGPGQKKYVTSADLAVELYKSGVLSEERAEMILDQVSREVHTHESKVYDPLIPDYLEMDLREMHTHFRSVADGAPESWRSKLMGIHHKFHSVLERRRLMEKIPFCSVSFRMVGVWE